MCIICRDVQFHVWLCSDLNFHHWKIASLRPNIACSFSPFFFSRSPGFGVPFGPGGGAGSMCGCGRWEGAIGNLHILACKMINCLCMPFSPRFDL